MHDEIMFFHNDTHLTSQIAVVKLDDMYHLRPSLFRDGVKSVTELLNIDSEDIDVFDSMFMSATTSLILKNLKVDQNFINIITSIILYEIRITIDETESNFEVMYNYLKVFENYVNTKFDKLKDIETDNVVDVTFTFTDNKHLAFALMVGS